jgi:hypothetical protein
MSSTLSDFPFWILEFDKDGNPFPSVTTFLNEVPTANLTDLYIFSHGWNNDRATALDLYTRFYAAMRAVLNDPSVKQRDGLNIGVAGVIWPSILFPGDTPPATGPGGSSSFTGTGTAPTLESELPKAFCEPEQQQPLQDLIQMLNDRPPSNDALLSFRDKLTQIVSAPKVASSQDNAEAVPPMSDDQWMQFLNLAADAFTSTDSAGGAADLGGFFDRLWNGAKGALRVATYWEMKNRAGVVGKKGVGPMIGKVQAAVPALRIHLLGHSFGARVVSYTLAGLPDGLSGPQSPVKTLFLLQGAFSHFAFCSELPFDKSRSGDLKGMAARVDGPLMTTHSKFDSAVGVAYPAASFLAGADASDVGDALYRWEGMGCDGAQDPDAATAALGDVHTPYTFTKGKWLNLDGNSVITAGGPPSGAHSDIVHPHTAWAALAASQAVS